MRIGSISIVAVAAATLAQAALADTPGTVPITGTRLEIGAEGSVTRAPDVATLSAGVVTQAATATEAMAQNARRMAAAVAALRRAGIVDTDIKTASLSLQPQYRYAENQPPAVTGYQASNQLSVTFRDIARTGAILDALVGQGVNQISGPNFALDHPEAALDDARIQAMASAQARAAVYAKAAGLTVKRIVAISESGGYAPPAPRVFMMARAKDAATDLQPGEEKIGVTLQVTFELQ